MEVETGTVKLPTCATCKCYYTPTHKRNGNLYKTCERCRKNATEQYKCKAHGISKYRCIHCHGSSMCVHGRQIYACKDCHGSSICEHDKQRHTCKLCGNPITKTCYIMVGASKMNDIKYGRYDASNFITHDHVHGLILQSDNKCFYCTIPLQYTMNDSNMATIERLDNTMGHVIGNCVIACKSCNLRKVGSRNIDPNL